MSVFVVVAAAFAVVAVGALLVGLLKLRAATAQLRAATRATTARLAPLATELREEAAVTAVESAQLSEGLSRWSDERVTQNRRRRRPRRNRS